MAFIVLLVVALALVALIASAIVAVSIISGAVVRQRVREKARREAILKNDILSVGPAFEEATSDPSLALPVLDDERFRGHRGHVVQELLTSERFYLSQLVVLIHGYRNPLRELARNSFSFISSTDVSKIFQHLEVLCDIHRELYARLRKEIAAYDPDTTDIGSLLADLVPAFKLYTAYVATYYEGSVCVSDLLRRRSDFSMFCDERKERAGFLELDLPSLLVAPVQRLPRLLLLLKELLKHTKSDHSDYAGLKNVVDSLSEIMDTVNEGIREGEARLDVYRIQSSLLQNLVVTRVVLIEPQRRFVVERNLMKRRGAPSASGERPLTRRRVVLFNDLLIYGSPVPGRSEMTYLRQKIPLVSTSVTDLDEISLRLESGVKATEWVFESQAEKREFAVVLEDTIKKCRERRNSLSPDRLEGGKGPMKMSEA